MTTYLRCFGRVPVEKRGFDEECLNCSTKLLCEPLNLPVKEEYENITILKGDQNEEK